MRWLYKLYGKIITFISNIRIYPLGIVIVGNTSYQVKGPDLRRILDCIKPGDVVLSSFKHYLSSFFIPGKFSHIGIYVGNNQVIHVTTHGCVMEDILTFTRTDSIAVCRFKDQTKVDPAIEIAEKIYMDGEVEYDFSFNTKNTKRFYCIEFTDYCYDRAIRAKKGRDKILYPDDCLDEDLYEIIFMKG